MSKLVTALEAELKRLVKAAAATVKSDTMTKLIADVDEALSHTPFEERRQKFAILLRNSSLILSE